MMPNSVARDCDQDRAIFILAINWHSQAETDHDYKVFAHLIDEARDIVGQHDSMPCNWTCPTSQWEIGQRAMDEAAVSILGIPGGEYDLAAGMHVASTGERSQLRDTS
jgi:hypothetical protein